MGLQGLGRDSRAQPVADPCLDVLEYPVRIDFTGLVHQGVGIHHAHGLVSIQVGVIPVKLANGIHQGGFAGADQQNVAPLDAVNVLVDRNRYLPEDLVLAHHFLGKIGKNINWQHDGIFLILKSLLSDGGLLVNPNRYLYLYRDRNRDRIFCTAAHVSPLFTTRHDAIIKVKIQAAS